MYSVSDDRIICEIVADQNRGVARQMEVDAARQRERAGQKFSFGDP